MGRLHTTNGVCIAISQKRRDQPRLPGQNLSDGAFWAKRRSETNRLLDQKIHQQLAIVWNLDALRVLGCPILLYAARKPERLARIMMASAVLHAGADYIRTHTPEMIWRLHSGAS